MEKRPDGPEVIAPPTADAKAIATGNRVMKVSPPARSFHRCFQYLLVGVSVFFGLLAAFGVYDIFPRLSYGQKVSTVWELRLVGYSLWLVVNVLNLVAVYTRRPAFLQPAVYFYVGPPARFSN